MGRGELTANLGVGQYTVDMDYGAGKIAALVAGLQADIARWTTAKATADADLASVSAGKPALLASLDSAIADYRAALNSGVEVNEAKDAVNSAVQEVFKYEIDVQAAMIPTRSYEAQIAQAERQVAYMSNFNVETTDNIWCVDYSEEVDVPVTAGTIEIPGESLQTLIRPGCSAAAPGDGYATARPAQSPEQLFLNLALLPGWQKFSPTYRIGIISNIDFDFDTADVFLDGAYSSAQGLSVNQGSGLYGIPVEYMNCHAAAFQDGDSVVVQFDAQDWETPKVIGFESYPRACPVGRARYARILTEGSDEDTGDLEPREYIYIMVKGVSDGGPGTDIITYMRQDAADDPVGYRLCVEYRMEGEIEFNQMVQTGYHGPDPVIGPLGAVYRGVGYGPDNRNTGHVWIDDLYRYDETGVTSGFEYEMSYHWDKIWKLNIGLLPHDFPSFQSEFIEVRIHRYDVAKPYPLKKLVHFLYKFNGDDPQVLGVEDIDAMNISPGYEGKPIIKVPPGVGFPAYQPVPDYW